MTTNTAWDWFPPDPDLLAESPMFRYECCEHCRTWRCPRHDGHPDPCTDCEAGTTMLGMFDPASAKGVYADQMANDPSKPPTCGICRRERSPGDPEHPMDSYDYNAIQALTGQPLGWYSGNDGQICPEDMTKMIAGTGV